MISREAPAVMNLLKALSLLASDALVRTLVANSDVQSRLILEMTSRHVGNQRYPISFSGGGASTMPAVVDAEKRQRPDQQLRCGAGDLPALFVRFGSALRKRRWAEIRVRRSDDQSAVLAQILRQGQRRRGVHSPGQPRRVANRIDRRPRT